MPSKYKLTYFNGRGRAEIIRIMFVAANQRFEDHRVEVSEWPAMKPTTPWGGVPLMEVNGRLVAQSGTIVRFLARQLYLAGEDKWEEVLVDSVLDAVAELLTAAINIGESKAGELEKADAIRKFRDHVVPVSLTNFDRFIVQHGNNGFTVGNHMTAADIAIFNVIDSMNHHGVLTLDSLSHYPAVKGVLQLVQTQPRIAEYLRNRTDSVF